MYSANEKTKRNLSIYILIGVSLFARLLFLGKKSFWIDECLAWGTSRLNWGEMLSSVSTGTPHPPVAFVLMKLSSILAGSNEFGLRLLIALAVASAVIPVFRLASRRTTARGGFWAGMVWALSPFAVSLGQEAWVYGINASLSLWFADTADLAWRGSKKAFIGTFLFGVAGILTQHIFVLSIAAGSVLYFTVDRSERIPLKKFLVVPGVLALLYFPVFLFFSAQFAERSSRMASAGMQTGFARLFSTQPLSEFFKILPGGLLPDMSSNLFDRPRMFTAYIVNAAVILSLSIWPFFTDMLKSSERRYLWLCFLIPFGLFFTDEPTVRQLSIIWIPLAVSSSAVFSRFRWSGAAVSLLCLLALIPYYRMDVYPYHRSNWRDAATVVDSLGEPDDIVVVFGGKSTSFAWKFYSNSELNVICPSGDRPFAADRERASVAPGVLIDSLFSNGEHNRVWVVLDVWGISSIQSIRGHHTVEYFLQVSENMEVALLRD